MKSLVVEKKESDFNNDKKKNSSNGHDRNDSKANKNIEED